MIQCFVLKIKVKIFKAWLDNEMLFQDKFHDHGTEDHKLYAQL